MADATPTDGSFPDIPAMRYEDAREELVSIVAKLEAGQAPLEDSMHLWRRGEALAAHCGTWLDGAQAEIERATRPQQAARGQAAGTVHADDAVFDDQAGEAHDEDADAR